MDNSNDRDVPQMVNYCPVSNDRYYDYEYVLCALLIHIIPRSANRERLVNGQFFSFAV